MNLDSILAKLISAQLLRRAGDGQGTYSFKNALTQDAAYQSLLHQRRRQIHKEVARAYEASFGQNSLDDYAAVLAHHYFEAGDDEKALLYATQAGDLASRRYAHTEALEFYTRALDAAKRINATTAQFVHLYTARGRAFELRDDYPRAIENYREMQTLARSRGERSMELASMILQGTAYSVGTGGVRDLRQAQDYALRALELARELKDRAAQARIYWNLLLINRFGSEGPLKAIEYGERSLAIARELGLQEQLALALKDLGPAYAVVGRIEEGKARGLEGIALWRQLNNTPMLAEVLAGTSQMYFMHGKVDDSIRLGGEALQLNRSIGNRFGLSIVGGLLWYSYRERGEMSQAIELAKESTSIGDELQLGGVASPALVELGATYDWLGDHAQATDCASRVLGQVKPGMEIHPIFPSAVMASIALHRGNIAAAEGWLDPYPQAAVGEHFSYSNVGIVHVFSTWVELALAKGDASRALAVSGEFAALIQERDWPVFRPWTLYFQARALRLRNGGDEAYALLMEARRLAESMGTRYRLLPILLTLAEMENERSKESAANQAAVQAREVIAFIAEHTPLALRESFLKLPAVARVFSL